MVKTSIIVYAFLFLIISSLSFSSILWSLPLGITADKASALSTRPLIFEENLYVFTSQGGYVYAVLPSSGKSVWSKYVGGYPKDPVKFSDMIVVANSNGTFSAFRRDGVLRWNVSIPLNYVYGIVATDSLIYATTSDGVFTIDKSGNVQLFYNVSDVTYTAPAADSSHILFGYGQYLYALSTKGDLLWKAEIPGGVWYSAPVIDGSMVFIGGLDNNLYAFDVSDGFYRWKVETNGWIMSTPLAKDGIVWFGSNDGKLYSVREATGELRWEVKTKEAVQTTPALSNIGGEIMVFFGSNDNNLYAVDDATGKVLWKTSAKDWVGSPAVSGRFVVFPSHDGRVYAVSTERACTFDYPEPDSLIGYREILVNGKVFSEYGDATAFVNVNHGEWMSVTVTNGSWSFILNPNDYPLGIVEIECKIKDSLAEESAPFTSLSITRTSNLPVEKFNVAFPLHVQQGKEFEIFVLDDNKQPVLNFNAEFQGQIYVGNGSVRIKALEAGSAQKLKITKPGFSDTLLLLEVSSSGDFAILAVIGAIVVLAVGAAYYKLVMKK